MKTKYLFFILVILLLSACATTQHTPPNPVPEAKPVVPAESSNEKSMQGISPDVKELLDKSKTRVKNIYYRYRGPETGTNLFEFYVKDTKIKYLPARELKILDKPESYNAVYIDSTAKTAQTYCDDRTCLYKGKKSDLNYNSAYIMTISDWAGSITSAQKVGEEVIDDRSAWKIETNKGTMWVDTFYGIPLKIESGNSKFRFEQLGVNSVQNSDVNPSS